MQTKCLRLMGKKLLVALTLEGKFAGEGLHDLEDDDDMLSAMARELVQEDGIGETADAVWSQLKEVYDQLPRAAREEISHIEDEIVFDIGETVLAIESPLADLSHGEMLASSVMTTSAPTLFGQSLQSARRRGKRTRVLIPEQGFLFGLN
jgi:hypothetical protein